MPALTPKRQRDDAALLVAQAELNDEQIAERVGVTRTTLYNWKGRDDFQAVVAAHQKELRELIRSHGIAVRENRIKALQDRWQRMQRVIAERADDPKMQAVAGGKTGLLVHNVKAIGAGIAAERVDLYEVDTGLLKELRDTERQAAQELGQWQEDAGPGENERVIRFRPIVPNDRGS